MSVEYIWWKNARPYVPDGSGTWSLDFNIPAQTVYAFSAMQSSAIQSNFATATEINVSYFSGVIWYFTIDPSLGNVLVLHNVGLGATNNVVPGIFDDNVTQITFLYGLAGHNDAIGEAGGYTSTWADFTFQVFGWGNP